MEIRGKFIGGIAGVLFGFFIGAPLGAFAGFVLGTVLGHFFYDLPAIEQESQAARQQDERKLGAFLFHVFRLCAKLAKSDGQVNQAEIDFMERLMRMDYPLNAAERAQAINVWKKAKDTDVPFEVFARAFYVEFARERDLIQQMMLVLFRLATVDGMLHHREEDLLLRAAGIFHISRNQFETMKARFTRREGPRQASSSGGLSRHYAVLGASPKDSVDVIKKKFRALAMQYHPDKLAAKGASNAAQEKAKEKFQQINEAYEVIMEARRRI